MNPLAFISGLCRGYIQGFVIGAVLCALLLFITGCTATGNNGTPPTPAQVQSASQINSGLAFGARLAYGVVTVQESNKHTSRLAALGTNDAAGIAKENARYKRVTDAEAFVPPLLNQLDKAAAGDAVDFNDLIKQESIAIVTVLTESNQP